MVRQLASDHSEILLITSEGLLSRPTMEPTEEDGVLLGEATAHSLVPCIIHRATLVSHLCC